MTLARIRLGSGREIGLDRLQIHSTYGGLLEGYPNPSMNDRILTSLGERREFRYRTAPPVHLIDPPRTNPYPDERPLSFGPVEVLPPVCCVGFFDSSRIAADLDEVLHRSWLDVVWFQDDIAGPTVESVTAAVVDLPWDDLAEDYEL
ncbi:MULTISPECIES: hypothetical protein [Actinomadura]|uniref:hypothetical protein n=1 Tax=Actinomadura TaxID=1988 RepID=UPI000478E831|nr:MULTISPECIES: hypothetical protein [Actinomadura]RSN63896.1 hypothetical protein DMH08_18810 [Actinomadura sp. WAC 06369]